MGRLFRTTQPLRFLKAMIHVIYLSIIGLIVFFGGRKLRKTRRAFFTASELKDGATERLNEASVIVFRQSMTIGAQWRREMGYLATIESQRKQLKEAEERAQQHLGFIAIAKEWAGEIREGLKLGGSLPAAAGHKGAAHLTPVRVTGRLGSAPIFSGRAQ
jgi:hypothetical protein